MGRLAFFLPAATLTAALTSIGTTASAQPKQMATGGAVLAAPCVTDPAPASPAPRTISPECPVRFELCDNIYLRGVTERNMSCRRNVKDLSLLRCLSRVDNLRVRGQDVHDWRHVAALHELRTLRIEGGRVDLRALATMPQLHTLELNKTRSVNHDALAALPHLRTLRIAGERIDSRVLTKLPQLQTLSLEHAPDLAFVKAQKDMRNLSVGAIDRADLRLLRHTPCLDRFAMGGGKVSHYPAQWPAHLTKLQLNRIGLTGLPSGIGGTRLAQLDLSFNRLKQLDVSAWNQLSKLTLSHNPITLSGLTLPPSIQWLHLNHTAITDLKRLSLLKQLEVLEVAHTRTRSLAPLSGMRQLRWLDISHTEVRDLSPLLSTPKLNAVRVQGTPVRPMDLMTIKAQRNSFNPQGKPAEPPADGALKMAPRNGGSQ